MSENDDVVCNLMCKVDSSLCILVDYRIVELNTFSVLRMALCLRIRSCKTDHTYFEAIEIIKLIRLEKEIAVFICDVCGKDLQIRDFLCRIAESKKIVYAVVEVMVSRSDSIIARHYQKISDCCAVEEVRKVCTMCDITRIKDQDIVCN